MRLLTRFTQRLIKREPSPDFRLAHERLRLAMEAGRSVGWDWDVKTGRDVWFGDLQTMFGICTDLHESRVEDFHQRVHPDDRAMVGKAVAEARRTRTMYRATFRVVRTDATIRWVAANGRFYYGNNGEAIRMLGIAEDVTDRVRAEEARCESEERARLEQRLANEALSGLSGRLMKAQESERASIAKELHDDLAQRMALLRFELEMLQQTSPHEEAGAGMRTRVEELCGRATALGKDLQAISARLHSAKLEYLGIAAAAEGFCREMGKQHGVTIDFKHFSVPEDLPKDIALCLFRVLQEAVDNAVKHAGVHQLTVILAGSANTVQLEVRDEGAGFDLEMVRGSHGLGLASMQERLRLVNGHIFIESQRGAGTTVKARVPLQLAS